MIMVSRVYMNFESELFHGFPGYWSVGTNAFIFLQGMMTLTLHDVVAILGFPIISTNVSVVHTLRHRELDFIFSKNT